MRIVVDAMRSADFPHPDIKGVVTAAKEYPNDEIMLIGDESHLSPLLSQYARDINNIHITHINNKIDNPSIHAGMVLVQNRMADAFITTADMDKTYQFATNILEPIVQSLCSTSTYIYKLGERLTIFLDAGSNTESKPEWLAQYALMGSIYAKNVLSINNPRVGLVSNGSEEGKGTSLILESANLISQLPLNFIGNIEPSDIHNGLADVVITDGFVGNIMLDTFASTVQYITTIIDKELQRTLLSQIGVRLAKGAFGRSHEKTSPTGGYGSPILGLDGVIISTNGNVDEVSIYNAINQARLAVNANIIECITQEIQMVNHHS